jgi:hypothetical protein
MSDSLICRHCQRVRASRADADGRPGDQDLVRVTETTAHTNLAAFRNANRSQNLVCDRAARSYNERSRQSPVLASISALGDTPSQAAPAAYLDRHVSSTDGLLPRTLSYH